MRRGDLYWCDLGGGIGSRPVMLLSRDGSYRIRGRATVALVTSRIRGLPVEVPIGEEAGLRHLSVVNVDEIYTVRLDQLGERMGGSLDASQFAALDAALHYALGLRH